ncbi:MAG: hypothetical protein R2865_01515 [Deinococcales bacterium]
MQYGFREWFGSNFKADASNPASGSGYRYCHRPVNLPADKTITKIELLETLEVCKATPTTPPCWQITIYLKSS